MPSRKKYLWNDVAIPPRTRYRKKRKILSTSNVIAASDAGGTNTNGNTNNNADGTNANAAYFLDETETVIDDGSDYEHNREFSELDNPIYTNSKLSLKNSLLLIMAFVLKFHVTNEALDSLLKIFSLHMPESPSFPKTKYRFFQHFQAYGSSVKLFVPCGNCHTMLSDHFVLNTDADKEIVCTNCNESNQKSRSNSTDKLFVIFDIKKQIEDLLADPVVQKHIFTNNDTSDKYGEITSGNMYKDLKKNAHDITLSFNTDGVPLFQSSNASVWPLQLVINELPYSIRKKYIILGGLWLGGSKSPVDEYFESFIEDIDNISRDGISWKFKNSNVNSKIYVVLCSCDSVARCKLQNIVQFNGYYGCSWCEKEGRSVEKGRGRMMSYDEGNSPELAPLRSLEKYYEASELAIEKNSPVLGVKGPSFLTSLDNFNVITSFVVDYMHCICLGIVKSFTKSWLNSTQQDPFYVSNSSKSKLDEYIVSIKTPTLIRRKPRKLDQIAYWKASEFLYWLLFYSPILLVNILPKKFYNHWFLLVAAMHHLLDTSISNEQLNLVEYLLTKFVLDTGKLYGPEYVTYNVHMLLHIPDCVRNWGMIWNYSNFAFESFNGTLKKFVCGSQKVSQQIAQRFLTYQFVKGFKSSNSFEDSDCREIFTNLVRGYALVGHKYTISERGKLLTPNPSILQNKHVAQVFSTFKNRKHNVLYSFKYATYKGYRLIPKGQEHKSNKRSMNYIVMNENSCAVLLFLISYMKIPADVQDLYCVVNLIQFSTIPLFKLKGLDYEFKGIRRVESTPNSYVIWPVHSIQKIGISMKCHDDFIVLVPNALEQD